MSYNSVLNLKALVGGFYQEKDLVGAFSVIVKTDCETNGSFAALFVTPSVGLLGGSISSDIKGDPNPSNSRGSRQSHSCGGCAFPWMDWCDR